LVGEAVKGKVPGWLHYGMKGLGINKLIAGQTGNKTFMQGLKDEMFPQMLKSLKEVGINSRIWHSTTEGDKLVFLVSMLGVEKVAFTQASLTSVRDGIVNQLNGGSEGVESLQDQLNAFKVPDADVIAKADPSAAGGIDITIRVKKSALLKLNVPDNAPEKVPKKIRNAKWFYKAVRKAGVKETQSKNIAVGMCEQLVTAMQDGFKENGVIADVVAKPGENNGKKIDDRKMIEVTVRIDVSSIEPEAFARTNIVTIRDGFDQQITAKGPGGLEYELKDKFHSLVFTHKCGWKGPYPPQADDSLSCLPRPDIGSIMSSDVDGAMAR